MPLTPPFRAIPKDVVEWGRFFRDATATVSEGSIVDSQFAERSATSVIGRAQSTGGTPADIQAATDNTFLARRAGALGFDGLVDADIPDSIARDTDVDAAISVHEAASDPHPQYTTAAEVSAALPTAANPAGTVGLSAVNGVASTFMRSDAAPALSQSITPTWTGNHVFTSGVRHIKTASGFELWKDATPTVAGGAFLNSFTADLLSLAYYDGSWHEMWKCSATTITYGNGTDLPAHNFVGTIGFNGTSAIAKPTVTGSRGGNAALQSLLTALAAYGLITDSSS